MHVEFDVSQMKSPRNFITAWMITRLKEMEQHGLGVLVDGQRAIFEETPSSLPARPPVVLPEDEPVVVEEAALDRLRKKAAELTEELTALRWLTMRDRHRASIRKADYTCSIRVSTRLEDDKTWSATADDCSNDAWTRGHRSRDTAIGKALVDHLRRLIEHLERQTILENQINRPTE